MTTKEKESVTLSVTFNDPEVLVAFIKGTNPTIEAVGSTKLDDPVNSTYIELTLVELNKETNQLTVKRRGLKKELTINIMLDFNVDTLGPIVDGKTNLELPREAIGSIQYDLLSGFRGVLVDGLELNETLVDSLLAERIVSNKQDPLFCNSTVLGFPVAGRDSTLQLINCILEVPEGTLTKLGFLPENLITFDLNEPEKAFAHANQEKSPINYSILEDVIEVYLNEDPTKAV